MSPNSPSQSTTAYLQHLQEFAERLRGDANRLDHDADCAKVWFDRLQEEGLNIGASQHLPLSGTEFCEALAIFARVSGTFGFLFLQQLVANPHLNAPLTPSWERVGIAFGHLRRTEGVCPVWHDGYVNGFVPWMSGARIFDRVVLGMRDKDGLELLALVPAQDRQEFSHTSPLPLFACSGTDTVSVHIHNLHISAEEILTVRPKGAQAEGDAKGLLFHTPLLIGCIEALWSLIAPLSHLDTAIKQQTEEATKRLLTRLRTAFEQGNTLEGNRLRAEVGDFAVRLARLAMMAIGGNALLLSHPAQRLYREAMLYNLMAQTDVIVQDAFQSVLAHL